MSRGLWTTANLLTVDDTYFVFYFLRKNPGLWGTDQIYGNLAFSMINVVLCRSTTGTQVPLQHGGQTVPFAVDGVVVLMLQLVQVFIERSVPLLHEEIIRNCEVHPLFLAAQVLRT